MKQISMEQMKCLEELSAFCLPEVELRQAKESLEGLLDCFAVLEQLDTEGISPVTHFYAEENHFREDEIQADKKIGVQGTKWNVRHGLQWSSQGK